MQLSNGLNLNRQGTNDERLYRQTLAEDETPTAKYITF